jgi:hypothetical protein
MNPVTVADLACRPAKIEGEQVEASHIPTSACVFWAAA